MRHALLDAASATGDPQPVGPSATRPDATRALLEVRDLAVSFGRDRPVRVVNEISFEIYPGEALGVGLQSKLAVAPHLTKDPRNAR